MSNPWDDVRRESLEMPALGNLRRPRPSPLPWMLLTVSIAMTIGVLLLGRSRLEDERVRTAMALKANDDVKSQLKAALAKIEETKAACAAADEKSADLSQQLVSVELENRRLQEELARARAAAPKGKK
jgi:septal ring factor EnvC (AmiA/AmiB activator)